MSKPKKFSNEQIIDAYKETGSVWKAAKLLGACGQSVWERLRALNYKLPSQTWSDEEVEELKRLAPQCTIGEIARRLGRPYAGTACKISELQLGVRFGNCGSKKVPRGSGFNKQTTGSFVRELFRWDGSLRQFCRQRGLEVELLVAAIQQYQPEDWERYVKGHSTLTVKECPECKRQFIPMNGKQRTCSRKCSYRNLVDRQYFGGQRSLAVGMQEGICQLCEKETQSHLAAHHVYGKENDPENAVMIALCRGCHQLVGSLGVRADAATPAFWENLIALAVMRKLGKFKPLGYYIEVEIEELTQDDIEAI